MYRRLYRAFGPQGWWPGDTPFEIAVGAILTQNTNWRNVERAIDNLRRHGILTPEGLCSARIDRLSFLIRPSGYFNIKAKRLKNFMSFIFANYGGKIEDLKGREAEVIRRELLEVKGIGPETADSIMLYALDYPVFVVDAYTRRILKRHYIIDEGFSYDDIQELFHNNINRDVRLYNEFHALFVKLGKEYCRKKPICDGCPLMDVRHE